MEYLFTDFLNILKDVDYEEQEARKRLAEYQKGHRDDLAKAGKLIEEKVDEGMHDPENPVDLYGPSMDELIKKIMNPIMGSNNYQMLDEMLDKHPYLKALTKEFIYGDVKLDK